MKLFGSPEHKVLSQNKSGYNGSFSKTSKLEIRIKIIDYKRF